MATLADLKKRSANSLQVKTAAFNQTEGYNADDDKFWKPERDKAGNASAEIRFLDAHETEELPFVKLYSHSFQGPTGRWYIENCRSTIGEEDPVNEFNRTLWSAGEAEKKQATAQKRKLAYISRILVISDPKHPENDGKQFFFKYGKKIYDKIVDKAQPTFEDDKPVDIFNLWTGANFQLRMKTVDKFPNYDSSVFKDPSPVADTDEEILEIYNAQEPIAQFVDVSKFKSFDELDKKFKAVLYGKPASTSKAEDVVNSLRDKAQAAASGGSSGKKEQKVDGPAPIKEKTEQPSRSTPADTGGGDDEDMDSFFKNLAD